MPESIPTPFDIVPPPFFPWQPGLHAFLLVLAAALAAVFAARLWAARERARTPVESAFSRVKKALAAAVRRTGPASTAETESISLLLRRLLSACEGEEIAGLTPRELGARSERARGAALGALMRAVAALDAEKYAPPDRRQTGGPTADTFRELDALVDRYREERDAPARKEAAP